MTKYNTEVFHELNCAKYAVRSIPRHEVKEVLTCTDTVVCDVLLDLGMAMAATIGDTATGEKSDSVGIIIGAAVHALPLIRHAYIPCSELHG